MHVFVQIVCFQVALGIGNGCVKLSFGCPHLDQGSQRLQVKAFQDVLLLGGPGIVLGAARKGEAGQEGATVEVYSLAEILAPHPLRSLKRNWGVWGEGSAHPLKSHHVRPGAPGVQPDLILRNEQQIGVRQSVAQVS